MNEIPLTLTNRIPTCTLYNMFGINATALIAGAPSKKRHVKICNDTRNIIENVIPDQ